MIKDMVTQIVGPVFTIDYFFILQSAATKLKIPITAIILVLVL
jgi:hypothetical protein